MFLDLDFQLLVRRVGPCIPMTPHFWSQNNLDPQCILRAFMLGLCLLLQIGPQLNAPIEAVFLLEDFLSRSSHNLLIGLTLSHDLPLSPFWSSLATLMYQFSSTGSIHNPHQFPIYLSF